MELLRGQPAIAAVRETVDGTSPLAAICIDPDARRGQPLRIVAIASPHRAVLIDAQQTPTLGETLSQLCPLGAHEAKTVQRALLNAYGATLPRWACISLSEQLLAGGRDVDMSLGAIGQRYLQMQPPALDGGFEAMGAHTQALAGIIAAQVAAIREHDLSTVSRIEAAAVAPIAHMEHHGMCLDARRWKSLSDEARSEQQSLSQELGAMLRSVGPTDLLGETEINLESNTELKTALARLGFDLPNVKRATLQSLPPPLGPALVRYREVSKIVSTYGDSFLEHVRADGRIHATFEQIGASTGRMACHSPNLQAIVKDSAHRDCFQCPEDRRLVVADYATCELRILAQMSRDPVFTEAFERGEDLHSTVASTLWKKPVSKSENPELRNRAKAVNFGLVYGMGPGGLARALDVHIDQARQLLDQYFRTFPAIRSFLEQGARQSIQRGYASTLSGRRLYLEHDDSPSGRAQAERIAKNMPIQGTSADITKLALARIHSKIRSLPETYLVNAVHDEVVVECPDSEAEATADIVRREMIEAAGVLLTSTPVEVDVAIGRTWGK